MKLLSVIVPVYNKSKYLAYCIESILNQEFDDFSVVLVDDGSTDGCDEICEGYALKYDKIKYIRQENEGPIKARFTGIKYAETEYITFVDADDWISPETYKSLSEYMESGIDCITYSIVRFFNEKEQYRTPSLIPAGIYDKKSLEEKVYPHMIWSEKRNTWMMDPSLCTKVIKKKYLYDEFNNVQDLGIHYGEDVAVIYPLLSKINTLAVTESGSYFHRQADSGDLKEYLRDKDYYAKLFRLYAYLKDNIYDSYDFFRQIDFMYADSIKMGLLKYGKKQNNFTRFLFPFNLVERNSRIVLFGAGAIGKTYMNQVYRLKYCEIVLWIDRNYEQYKDLEVDSPERIGQISGYDHVVIAVKRMDQADEIKAMLTGLGVEKEKIIWQME